MDNIYIEIAKLLEKNQSGILAILIDVKGHSPRKAGTKMLVLPTGMCIGTIGGGKLEKEVISKALAVLKSGKPLTENFSLCENRDVEHSELAIVYFEPIIPNPQLYIFGAGHVGREIGRYANEVGFNVRFIDPRPHIFEEFDTTFAQCITMEYEEALEKIEFEKSDYVVISTPSHQTDTFLTHKLAKHGLTYLGVLASKHKAQQIRENGIKNNLLSPEEAQNIDMPMGVPINTQTPREIAISVVARLIDIKNNKTLK